MSENQKPLKSFLLKKILTIDPYAVVAPGIPLLHVRPEVGGLSMGATALGSTIPDAIVPGIVIWALAKLLGF